MELIFLIISLFFNLRAENTPPTTDLSEQTPIVTKGISTFRGITVTALNNYIINFEHPEKIDVPTHTSDLSEKQAMVILNQTIFRNYNIDIISQFKLSQLMFDYTLNLGPQITPLLTNEVAKLTKNNIEIPIIDNIQSINKKYIIPQQTTDILSNLSDTQISQIIDNISDIRINSRFKDIEQTPQLIRFINGWYDRIKNYYSNSDNFDKKYLKRKQQYIKKYAFQEGSSQNIKIIEDNDNTLYNQFLQIKANFKQCDDLEKDYYIEHADNRALKIREKIYYQTNCYEEVAYEIFATFHPKEYFSYKENFDNYQNSLTKVLNDAYYPIETGNTGSIIADYVSTKRLLLIRTLVKLYLDEVGHITGFQNKYETN